MSVHRRAGHAGTTGHVAQVAARVVARAAALAPLALVVVLALGLGPAVGPAGAASAPPGAATGDGAPVDLSTSVDLSAGTAHRSAVVRVGDARFEVLSPTLLRLEYSPTGHFENRPTVNALDRRLPVPPYRAHIAGGWLSLRTSRSLLRYRVGSGPFTTANTTLQLSVDGHTRTVRPEWEWECPFDQVCQAGAATLAGGATLSQTVGGYDSTAGYVGYLLVPGARATWPVLAAPAGPAVLTVRYTNVPFPVGSPAIRQLAVTVDGHHQAALTVAPTDATDPWATATAVVTLRAGTNTVALGCTTGETCYTAGIDTVSVAPPGAPAPVPAAAGALGGWIRGFDTATYNTLPTCAPGQQGATCQAVLQPLETDGLLDTDGWRLLDDTHSAVWTSRGWVQPRPVHGDEEDGYLFVYGHDYTGALETLARLTGPAPLLPRDVFGVWYSDYTPYSSATIEGPLYAAFVANHVPLDTLSLDTDWKAPNDWNGWEWNPALFPDPSSFLSWAHRHGIDVTLNIHSSIDDNDPQLARAERVAGAPLADSTCTAGGCKVWDWSSVPQAESNFTLQQPLARQGVSFWWLDWCCDDSVVSMPGVTPDSWIDHLYAQELTDRGQRGFVLARIGGSNGGPETVYPAGPWSAHTSAIAFTGDAWGTWNTLAREAELTSAEASIGEPYVSDDIGSYLGPPPTQSGADPADLYDRWVQLGTFQPILRLHSNNEDRLPWQYPQPVRDITAGFLRLRQSLVPYTYTLAAQAHQDGLPMARSLYLDYPDQAQAYDHSTEYLYGPDVLVAPVTTPGDVATATVWLPPGRWIDYFTGATLTGPATTTLSVPLDRMPVFVRAGGIVPEQPSTAPSTGGGPLTLKVYAGADGSFRLYDDAGHGLGYTKGQDTETPIITTTGTATTGTATTGTATTGTTTAGTAMTGTAGTTRGSVPHTQVTVGPALGRYPGRATTAAYRIELVDLSPPTTVTLDGRTVPERAGGASTPGWSYQPTAATLTIDTGTRPTGRVLTVVEVGGSAVTRAEPAAPPT